MQERWNKYTKQKFKACKTMQHTLSNTDARVFEVDYILPEGGKKRGEKRKGKMEHKTRGKKKVEVYATTLCQ